MNKHFAYLTNNDEATFFQKVANELAESKMVPATASFAKEASARPMIKLASRVDRDLDIIKTAGPCGMNLGMQTRAGAYIDHLIEQGDLTGEELEQVFDKVAGEAIITDLQAARDYLSEGISPELQPWLDGELAKIGRDLTKAAMMDKESNAFLKTLWKAPSIIGRAAQTRWRGMRAGHHADAIKGHRVKLDGLRQNLKAQEQVIADRVVAGKNKGWTGALGEEFQANKANDLRMSIAKIKGKVGERQKALLANLPPKVKTPKAPPAPAAGGLPPAPTPTPTVATVTTPPAKGKGGKGGKGKGGQIATPPAAPPSPAPPPQNPPPPAKGADPDASLLNAASEGGVTMKQAYEKARDLGWKALSGEEKQKLITAGAAVVVGGRVVLGGGILTGGDGLV